jgi:hypothetical protein
MTSRDNDPTRDLKPVQATTAGADPGNTDPELLTASLDPDDDVYNLLDDEQRQRAAGEHSK